MSITVALLSYLFAATLVTITPGLDTALVVRTAIVDGARTAILAAAGILAGVLAWGLFVAIGIAALIAASAAAYTILKWAGAIYLAYIGIKLLLHPRANFDPASNNDTLKDGAGKSKRTTPGPASRTWLIRGFMTNLLNPKMGIFYMTFLPQFVPGGVNVPLFMFLLACIHSVLGIFWFALLIGASQSLSRFIRKPGVVTNIDRATGAMFILLGIPLVMEAL